MSAGADDTTQRDLAGMEIVPRRHYDEPSVDLHDATDLCECGFAFDKHWCFEVQTADGSEDYANVCPTAVYRPAKCKAMLQDGGACGLPQNHIAHRDSWLD